MQRPCVCQTTYDHASGLFMLGQMASYAQTPDGGMRSSRRSARWRFVSAVLMLALGGLLVPRALLGASSATRDVPRATLPSLSDAPHDAPQIPPALPIGPDGSRDLWLTSDEVAALPPPPDPMRVLAAAAQQPLDRSRLTERDQHNVHVLAMALLAARTDDDGHRAKVRDTLSDVVRRSFDDRDVLAAARRLGTYVIAADIIGLPAYDPTFDKVFRRWLRATIRFEFSGDGPDGSMRDVQETRLNNFGTHAAASRIAVAGYLGDVSELRRAAKVFRGWLGDRAAYSDFVAGDLTWQAYPAHPVGINPLGSTLVINGAGRNVDGVLPDDQRRSKLSWPPPKESYVWGALSAAVVAAELLHRQGYPAWEWEDQALLRATRWLYEEADYPASGDDTAAPWLINHAYDEDFLTRDAALGKIIAFTDWTHAPRVKDRQQRQHPGRSERGSRSDGGWTSLPRRVRDARERLSAASR